MQGIEEKKKLLFARTPISLWTTNDLSSRIRTQVSYLVWATSMNRWAKNSPFLHSEVEFPIERNVENALSHSIARIDPSAIISLGAHSLTPLTLMTDKKCDDKLDLMFESLGISFAFFCDFESERKFFKWPVKCFFNEIANSNEKGPFRDLSLDCLHIMNPFLAIVGQSAFNSHAKLILQY